VAASGRGAPTEFERLYRALVANAHDAVLIFDPETEVVLEANARACQLFGLAPSEIVGFSLRDASTDADRDAVLVRRTVDRQGETHSFEVERRRSDRTTVWVEVNAAAIPYAGRLAVLSVERDITERKRVYTTLSESRSFLQATVDALPDQLVIVDEGGGVLAVNEAWRLAGRRGGTNDLVVGADYFGVFSRNVENAALVSGIRSVLAGERDEFVADYECASDAGARWFTVRASRFRDGSPRCVVTHTDITERKVAERALRESESRFRIMADTAPVLIWMGDADGRFVFVNTRWLDFTGRTLEQELGHGWTEGVHPDDRETLTEVYLRSVADRESFTCEYRFRRADGQYRWIAVTGVPFYVRGVTAYLGTCVDVTTHKEIDAVIRRAEREWVSTVDAVSPLILLEGVDGTILRCNKATQGFFELRIQEIVGRRMEELFAGAAGWVPDDASAVFEDIFRCRSAEVQFPSKAGWFEVTNYPIVEPSRA
jgi:PAS domain S-box-containing protein